MNRSVRWLNDQISVHGCLGGLRVLGRRLVGPEYFVQVRDLRAALPPIPATRVPLTSRQIGESDLPLLHRLDPAMTGAEVRRRWREWQRGWLYLGDGAPAYYRWDVTHSVSIPGLGVVLRLDEGDTYTVDVYTHPAFRGQAIAGAAIVAMLHRARDEGCRRAVTLTTPYNTRSLRNVENRAGFVVLGRVGYLGVGPFRRYFATGEVRLRDGSLSVPPLSEDSPR
jgi:RimJ/RimL family protein N-acetyltransferase